MLYNVQILNGVAITVTEHNPHCIPCNTNGVLQIPNSENRLVNINLPQGYKTNLPKLEAVKQYINLNHLV